MLGILGAIVVGDGASHGFGHTAQPSCEGDTHLPSALLAELDQPRVAIGPLHSDLQGLGIFREITVSVSQWLACRHVGPAGGAFGSRLALGYGRFDADRSSPGACERDGSV